MKNKATIIKFIYKLKTLSLNMSRGNWLFCRCSNRSKLKEKKSFTPQPPKRNGIRKMSCSIPHIHRKLSFFDLCNLCNREKLCCFYSIHFFLFIINDHRLIANSLYYYKFQVVWITLILLVMFWLLTKSFFFDGLTFGLDM